MPLFLLQPALAALVAPSGIQSHRWSRAAGQQSIAYEVAAPGPPTTAPPILLLNGFGVGSFHWHRVMGSIAHESGALCYGMDYLGQGGSWPVDCADGDAPSEAGLRYAIDDWAEQTIAFVEEVVPNPNPSPSPNLSPNPNPNQVVLADAPSDGDSRGGSGGAGAGGGGAGGGVGVRLVGNSLGGLLAVLLAARRPDLVKCIVLLNATPIWGGDLSP